MRKYFRSLICLMFVVNIAYVSVAGPQYELNHNWVCNHASAVKMPGEELSKTGAPIKGWLPAVVPGTVLTTMLHNKKIADPFIGMNNKYIPDIYETGNGYYTYWFVNDFIEKPVAGEHVWLQFRGVNYGCDIYLNGRKLNRQTEKGMYLKKEYDISPYLAKDGKNRLAVIVYPPDPPGKPNGGQGGDGTIARNICNQYVAGWDWIQPVHDRNTGIWDKVTIEKTKACKIENVFVKTTVPGIRLNTGEQEPATIVVTAEILNPEKDDINGVLQYSMEGRVIYDRISVPGKGRKTVTLPNMVVANPKLWWPNGYGGQNMYTIKVQFLADRLGIVDEEDATFGIREITTGWNSATNSRQTFVNGQRIFIKGANRILSDAMLRFSEQRYDAEVRYHHDMGFNLIRVWGGGITERPEFYDACDKYGLLVMQDLWITGDCNGRWHDETKRDDTTKRRLYPEDHGLWLVSCTDQVKMLRNHPSLAFWCGGNELAPPEDILRVVKDSLLPKLDGTRYFFEHSNHDSMSLHAHDGPYTIQKDNYFWAHRSYAFNSEIGSIGLGDMESIERIIPKANLVQPYYDKEDGKWVIDSVWQYHKFCSYDSSIEAYGHPANTEDFTRKAQLVNYNQYRAMMEGFSSHMWSWYTGVMVWKSQNPWTAMVGQMYDVYLDPNACMSGIQAGIKPLHVMYDPVWKSVMVANSDPVNARKVKLRYIVSQGTTNIQGINDSVYVIPPDTCIIIARAPDMQRRIDTFDSACGSFLVLRLYDGPKTIVDDNTYWFPGTDGTFEWLSHLHPSGLTITATHTGKGRVEVKIKNRSDANFSFFNHFSLVEKVTKKRILPVFCNNNYISVPPEGKKTIVIEYNEQKGVTPMVCIEEWNTGKRYIEITK